MFSLQNCCAHKILDNELSHTQCLKSMAIFSWSQHAKCILVARMPSLANDIIRQRIKKNTSVSPASVPVALYLIIWLYLQIAFWCNYNFSGLEHYGKHMTYVLYNLIRRTGAFSIQSIDAPSQGISMPRTRKIRYQNALIILTFGRRLGSKATEMPVKCQSEWKIPNTNLVLSGLCESLRLDVSYITDRVPKTLPVTSYNDTTSLVIRYIYSMLCPGTQYILTNQTSISACSSRVSVAWFEKYLD